IREDVLRYYTASRWAEIILRSFGGGGASRELYGVFRECLLLVRDANEEMTRLVCVQFMLRFLQFTGAPLDPDAVSDPGMRRVVASIDNESVEETVELAMGLSRPLPDALPYLVRSVQHVLELELNTVKTAGGILGLYS
ncbi:MAG: DNA repair protein RecO C-terminal domain-containing protein, partial [Spirochaetota bacterium]